MAFDAARPPARILIIKPSSLGDIVHALPVLAGLRAAYPTAHIAWLVSTGFAPLLAGHPLLDEVIEFDRRHYGRMLRSPRSFFDFWRFVGRVRRGRFDLVIDLQGLFRSGFLARASGAPRRIGFADARELAPWFYTQRVPGDRSDTHAVDLNLALARDLGLPVAPPCFPLGLRPQEIAAARQHLHAAAGEPVTAFTAVIPGARWESKRWPAQRWADLVAAMQPEGLPRPVLLGGPDERGFAARIRAACPVPLIDLIGQTTLRELTALISVAELVVCHDSGPMHIAAALKRPTVALFGPTNPARTGPYGDSARVAAYAVPCAPCYRRACPLGHHACMQQLRVESVLATVRERWHGTARPPITAPEPR